MELQKTKDEAQKAKNEAQKAKNEALREGEALREEARVLPPPTHPTLATIDHQPYYA